MDDPGLDERHLTALQVARYLDRKSSGAEREQVEAHLAECVECRRDVTNATTLVGRGRRPSRIAGAVATLLAASIVLVVGTRMRTDRDASTRELVRAAAGAQSALPVHAPAHAARAEALRFVWGAAPGALSYQFTLSRADGTPLFARSGSDTAVTIPDSVVLQSGARYLWTSDALLPDGSTRSTGVREVDVMP